MKMLTKHISLLLCLAVLITGNLYPALGEADGKTEATVFEISPEGSAFIFSYQINVDGTVTITRVKWNRLSEETSEDLIVPAEVDGHPVVTIGTGAFYGLGISSDDWGVKLPNWNVLLPETLVRIEEDAFESAKIARVFIPKNVVEMQGNPFGMNDSPCDIIVEGGNPVFEVINGMLMDKRTKTLVASGGKWVGADQIPHGTVAIGPKAFYDCEINSQLDFPETVTTIGRMAFGDCYWDEELEYVIPASVTHIEDWAFCDGYGLMRFSLPANLQHMGENPFSCDEDNFLESVTLHGSGDGLSIVDGALYNQRSKALVVLPIGVESTEFVIPEGTLRIDREAFCDHQQLKTVSIPDSVTAIGKNAFGRCTALESIQIPNGITTIEGGTFSRSGLRSLTLPENVTTIGDYAFSSCTQLTEVNLPEGLKRVGEGAFIGCTDLSSIPIPQGIEELGDMAFSECYAIEAFQLSGEHPRYETVDGVLFDKQEKSLLFYPCAKQGIEYTVPPGTLVIGPDAFYGNVHLLRIQLPQGLREIKDYAFDECDALREITLPATTIADSIADCLRLAKYISEEGVNQSGKWMLSGLLNRAEDGVVLPGMLRRIRNYILPDRKGFTKLVIPEGVQSIGRDAFYGCDHLKDITLPASLTFIESGTFGIYIDYIYDPDITFTAPAGSYAADYLEKKGFAVRKTE